MLFYKISTKICIFLFQPPIFWLYRDNKINIVLSGVSTKTLHLRKIFKKNKQIFWRLDQRVFFSWCIEIYQMLVFLPKVLKNTKRAKLIICAKVNTLKVVGKICWPFFFCNFCGEFKSQDQKSHQF